MTFSWYQTSTPAFQIGIMENQEPKEASEAPGEADANPEPASRNFHQDANGIFRDNEGKLYEVRYQIQGGQVVQNFLVPVEE
jgi:hypothetical protein